MRQLFADLAEACPLCAGIVIAIVGAVATVAAFLLAPFGVSINWSGM